MIKDGLQLLNVTAGKVKSVETENVIIRQGMANLTQALETSSSSAEAALSQLKTEVSLYTIFTAYRCHREILNQNKNRMQTLLKLEAIKVL